MKCIIPFESKVKFDYPVKEICSISLEHEITKNDDELLGNFFISGTCKEHELSINTNEYKFTIPFSLEYTNKIDPNTISFNIDNFTYDLNDSELTVKIDYEISADDIKEEDPYELIDNEYRQIDEKEEVPEEKEEEVNDYIEVRDDSNIIYDVKNDIASLNAEDDYAIYHIHYKKNEETVDSICSFYKISKEDLINVNKTDNIDDLNIYLIPVKDEWES